MKTCPLCDRIGKHDYRYAWCANRFCDLYDLSIPRDAWEGSVQKAEKTDRFSKFNHRIGVKS